MLVVGMAKAIQSFRSTPALGRAAPDECATRRGDVGSPEVVLYRRAGWRTASMTATWIWASSMYASATSAIHLRNLRAHPLWAVGRPHDPVHLPVRSSDPATGAPGPHPRGDHVRPARAIEPAHAGRIQRRRQPHQPDVELHRGRRTHLPAVTAQLHPGCARHRGRRAAVHVVVGIPGLRVDRRDPVTGHARRRRHPDPDRLLRRGIPGSVRDGCRESDSRPGQLLLE